MPEPRTRTIRLADGGITCGCCSRPVVERDPDPWEGRLDGYCEACALTRCDAFPGEHPAPIEEQTDANTEPVTIFEGDGGYEVHVDGGLFTVVDSELGREWGPLSLDEVTALHKVIGAALGANRLAEAKALLREIRDNGDRYIDWVDYEKIDAFLAAGDSDA